MTPQIQDIDSGNILDEDSDVILDQVITFTAGTGAHAATAAVPSPVLRLLSAPSSPNHSVTAESPLPLLRILAVLNNSQNLTTSEAVSLSLRIIEALENASLSTTDSGTSPFTIVPLILTSCKHLTADEAASLALRVLMELPDAFHSHSAGIGGVFLSYLLELLSASNQIDAGELYLSGLRTILDLASASHETTGEGALSAEFLLSLGTGITAIAAENIIASLRTSVVPATAVHAAVAEALTLSAGAILSMRDGVTRQTASPRLDIVDEAYATITDEDGNIILDSGSPLALVLRLGLYPDNVSQAIIAEAIESLSQIILALETGSQVIVSDNITVTLQRYLIELALASTYHGTVAKWWPTVSTDISDVFSQVAENVTLKTHVIVTANAAAQVLAAANVLICVNAILANLGASDQIASESLLVSLRRFLTLQDASHPHTCESLLLSTGIIVAIASAIHDQNAEALTLLTRIWLEIADAYHSPSADPIALSLIISGVILALGDTSHGHSAQPLVALLRQSLDQLTAANPQTAQDLNISLRQYLLGLAAVQDIVDSASLLSIGAHLDPGTGLHSHTSGLIDWIVWTILAPADTQHVHTAQTSDVWRQIYLELASVIDSLTAESVSLGGIISLLLADAQSALTAGELALRLRASLAPYGAAHEISVSSLSLSVALAVLIAVLTVFAKKEHYFFEAEDQDYFMRAKNE